MHHHTARLDGGGFISGCEPFRAGPQLADTVDVETARLRDDRIRDTAQGQIGFGGRPVDADVAISQFGFEAGIDRPGQPDDAVGRFGLCVETAGQPLGERLGPVQGRHLGCIQLADQPQFPGRNPGSQRLQIQ